MNWYWKVRIYRTDGHYYFGEIKTSRTLIEIDTIKDFYEDMTGCKMLLEGMSEISYGIISINQAFQGCWK